MSVQITLLGVPSVTRDGEPVALDTRKALALVAHLALCDRARSREALCDLLWPMRDARHARGALRRTLSTLRVAIGADRVQTPGDRVALRRGPGLRIDVHRFRELTSGGAPINDLGEAVSLFAGSFLEGFTLRDSVEFDDWQSAQADLLSRELGSALRRLVSGLSASGDHELALAHAHRWLELDPLHEPAHRELIRLHALNGERAAAIEQYRECVRTLSRELGVAPLQETIDCYEQINDGRLTPPPQAAWRPTGPGAAAVPPLTELPLLGRERDLAALAAAHTAARPDGRLAVIEGEAGIGKTRCFEELARRARAAGAVVLTARCHDDEAGLPYGPVIELLRGAL
ncbi:MAG: AAA family ATPase, partial [Actinomycetota bacterium]|nr:AAA family ATPase [Actinomycetota bacterium]